MLIGLRGAKSAAKVSMKTPLASVTVEGPADQIARLRTAEDDLRAVGRIASATNWVPGGDHLTVTAVVEPLQENA